MQEEKYRTVSESGLDGAHTPAFLGTAVAPGTDTLYVLQSHAGDVFADIDDPGLLLESARQVSLRASFSFSPIHF